MVASVYCFGALASSGFWLSAFLRDETTPNTHVASWVLVAIATVIWPLAVPLSMAELMSKRDSHLDAVLADSAAAEQLYT